MIGSSLEAMEDKEQSVVTGPTSEPGLNFPWSPICWLMDSLLCHGKSHQGNVETKPSLPSVQFPLIFLPRRKHLAI